MCPPAIGGIEVISALSTGKSHGIESTDEDDFVRQRQLVARSVCFKNFVNAVVGQAPRRSIIIEPTLLRRSWQPVGGAQLRCLPGQAWLIKIITRIILADKRFSFPFRDYTYGGDLGKI